MEPLYINRLELNEKVFDEWMRAEYRQNYRGWRGVTVVALVLYMLVAGVVFYSAFMFSSVLMGVLGGVFVLLAAVFLLVVLLRPRMQLKKLLAQNALREPNPQVVLFFEQGALPVSGPDALREDVVERATEQLQRQVLETQAVQLEFQLLVQAVSAMKPDDSEPLVMLRDELDNLQKRMDGLAQGAGLVNILEACGWNRLTGWYSTDNLFVLQYDEQVLLAARAGFEKGSETDFAVFLAEKLAGAETRRALEQKQEKAGKKPGKGRKATEVDDAGI